MSATAFFFALLTITLWSFLAFLGARVNHLPPLFVVGVALTTSGIVSMINIRSWRVPVKTLIIGIGGIFGYHFLYFAAFKYAPPIETNLMNYLWPLLIVLLSPLYLPSYKLHVHHLIGALLGLMGASLIITAGQLHINLIHFKGYVIAASAAFIWASYSLLTKRVPKFSTSAVGSFCLASGLLSFAAYSFTAESFIPNNLTNSDWVSLLLLGLGPMGAAFFTWDAAMKRGDPRIIGSLTYLTPLTSTLALILIGGQQMTWITLIAMVLIVLGAVIGSLDLLRNFNIREASPPDSFET